MKLRNIIHRGMAIVMLMLFSISAFPICELFCADGEDHELALISQNGNLEGHSKDVNQNVADGSFLHHHDSDDADKCEIPGSGHVTCHCSCHALFVKTQPQIVESTYLSKVIENFFVAEPPVTIPASIDHPPQLA